MSRRKRSSRIFQVAGDLQVGVELGKLGPLASANFGSDVFRGPGLERQQQSRDLDSFTSGLTLALSPAGVPLKLSSYPGPLS